MDKAMTDEHPVAGLWAAFDAADWTRARSYLADDFLADWPQTCERIRGADAFIALNAAYPGRWRCRLHEVIAAGDRATAHVTVSDGIAIFYAMSVYRLAAGKIIEAVEVFGDAMEPPYDRSQWAERYKRPDVSDV
jgi:hypothetical protein